MEHDETEETQPGVAPANDATADPTPEEAKAMFEENPGLAWVLTTEGGMFRDGSRG